MRNKLIILVGLLCISARSSGVTVSACKENLTLVFQKEQELINQIFARGKCWYLRYNMATEVFNPPRKKYQKVQDIGEIFATKTMRYVKAKDIEVFMDNTDVFTIDKRRKGVMRTSAMKGVFTDAYTNYLALIRDSMLKQMDVVVCKEVKENGKTLVQYELHSRTDKTPYSKVIVLADRDAHILRKMLVDINPAFTRNIRSYTITIEEETQRQPEPEWNNIRQMLLDGNGRLREPYKNYYYRDIKKNTKS